MPPRVTKKPKSKKPRPKLPDDIEFMLGEEISTLLEDNSPPSPTAEAEYSLTASPRGVLANLRFYGRDGGNDVSSATGSTLSSFQDQNDQNANNIGNITRFIPAAAIPEEAESQTMDDKPKKPKPKKKNKEKKNKDNKAGQLNRRESCPSIGHRINTEELTRSHSLESVAGTAGGQHPSRSSFSAAPRQNEFGPSSVGTSMNPAQQHDAHCDNVTAKSPSKAQTSGAHRRKSSPTKKKSTSGKKDNTRKTIGNDRDINLLRKISQLQSSTDCLIPKLPFARLIRETIQVYSGRDLRVTVECLQCLQEAAEIYAVQVIEDAYRCTLHRDRVTLTAKDMKLALLLRNECVSKSMP